MLGDFALSNCQWGDYILTELSVYWMSRMLLNCHRLWLICIQGTFTLFEYCLLGKQILIELLPVV